MQDSIFYFVRFSFFFFLYIVFIPAKVMGLKLSGKGAGENVLKSMIASNTVIISCVYLLGLLRIYNIVTLVILILSVILLYWKIVKKVSYQERFLNTLNWLALVSEGEYKIHIFIKDMLRRTVRKPVFFLKTHIKDILSYNFLEYLFVFVSLGILIARKWTLVFDNYAYLTSDMYVHHEWINFMEQGDIFYNGVYPFGMHNMISAFHKLAFLNLNIVFRYWGAFNCILLPVMLWFIAERIFHSKVVAVLPVIIYCVTDFTGFTYGFRSIYTLPQENGMLFLLPCFYFFGRFLKNKKWKDGLWFGMSAATILSMHFYSVIFAVLLCGCTCIAFIRNIIQKDMIKKLMLSVGLISLISITPLLLGLASGKSWQGSISWAISVMGVSDASNDNSETVSESDGKENKPDEKKQRKFKDKLVGLYKFQAESMNSYWGVVFWACMGLFIIYYIVCLCIKKIGWKEKMYAGIWLFLMVMVIMHSNQILGIPKIIKEERITMFIGYTAPLMLSFPAEMLYRIIPEKLKVAGLVGNYAIAVLLFYITYHFGKFYVPSYFYMEPSLASKACVKIGEEFPQKRWTVVSPVEGFSMVGNNGYHYELWDFISSMEVYNEDMYLEIPTQYVFFVLEKKPIIYNQYRVSSMEYDFEPLKKKEAKGVFTKEMCGISDEGVMKFYSIPENRRMMEAKLYCWLKEYSRAFPEQMEIYMEDEECAVYKFEQNPYMLNNFAINYKYNNISKPEYYSKLKDAMEKRGEDVSEIERIILELQQDSGEE